MQNHKEITNNLLPISGRVAGNGLTFGWRSNSEDDFPSDERETMKSPGKKSVRNRKATTKPQNPRPSSSQRAAPSTSAPSHNRAESPATAKAEHVDLTRSDDDTYSDSLKRSDRSSDLIQAAARNIETDLSAQRDLIRINKFAGAGEAPEKDSKNSTHENSSSQETNTAAAPTTIDPVLDVAPLPEDHDTTFLNEARLEFISKRPPFVRRNIKEDPRWMVTLAIGDGELPQIAVLTKLVTRQWDSSFSYYTLDLNGERLIVKPFGGKSKHKNRAGNPYRTWSGQGNVFERAPVAFSFLGDTEEQTSNRKVVGDDLDSDFGGISIQGSDSLGDEDYSSTTSEGSDSLLKPRATRARLAHLNTNRDNGDTNGDTRSSRAVSPLLPPNLLDSSITAV